MADGWKDFIAGTAGGFSAKVLDYPFDTVKVLLQTQNSLSSSPSTPTPTSIGAQSSTISTMPNYVRSSTTTTPNTTPQQQKVYRGAIHCLRHTIKNRGFFSLYRGMSSPLLGSMAENAVLFLCYGEIKKQMGEKPGQHELSLLQLATAGGMAGAVGAVALNPFEVIKGKKIVQLLSYPFFGNNSNVSIVISKTQCKCKS